MIRIRSVIVVLEDAARSFGATSIMNRNLRRQAAHVHSVVCVAGGSNKRTARFACQRSGRTSTEVVFLHIVLVVEWHCIVVPKRLFGNEICAAGLNSCDGFG